MLFAPTINPTRSTSLPSCAHGKQSGNLSKEGAIKITENILRGNVNQSRIVKHLINTSKRHKLHAIASKNLQKKFNSGNNSQFSGSGNISSRLTSMRAGSEVTYKRFPSHVGDGHEVDNEASHFNHYVINRLKESRLSIKKRIEKLKIISKNAYQIKSEQSERPSAFSPTSSSTGHYNLDMRYPDNLNKIVNSQTPQN